MNAPRGKRGQICFSRKWGHSYFSPTLLEFLIASPKNRNVPIFWKNRSVPFLLIAAILAGCHTSPEPRPAAKNGMAVAALPQCAAVATQLANFALTLRGTRYRYGGATRDGFDCSGLVFYAHRQFGLTVPRTSRDQSEQADEVKPRKLQPGDLVFFKIDSRSVNHVGIYLGRSQFRSRAGRGQTGDHQFTRRRVLRRDLLLRGPFLGSACRADAAPQELTPLCRVSLNADAYLGLRSATACSVRPLTVYGSLHTLLNE